MLAKKNSSKSVSHHKISKGIANGGLRIIFLQKIIDYMNAWEKTLRPPLVHKNIVGIVKDRNFIGKIPLKPFGL